MKKPRLSLSPIAEHSFAKLTFQEMVSDVAGRSLEQLIRGTLWRTIFLSAANEICAWRMAQPDIINAAKYLEK